MIVSLAVAGIAWAASDTYSSGNVHLHIPDEGLPDNGAIARIRVPDRGRADDVDALVRLNHARDQEIHLFLVSPSQTSVELSTDNGLSQNNYGTGPNSCEGRPTKFDDEAATPIVNGSPPYAGSFMPESPLSAFDGEKIKGTWKLKAFDDIHGDLGRLGCAKVRIKH